MRRYGSWPVVLWLVTVVLAVPVSAADSRPQLGGGWSPARDRFHVQDKHHYGSPWFAGAHRKMIPYGCTRAPFYPPSSRCEGDRGFHHGLDIAMRCGNRLDAGMAGRVVQPRSPGALGSAYGRHAFRLRNFRHDVDIVIGHSRRVFVSPGDRVQRGQRIARASDAGSPDGCHLHFEARPVAGGYLDAVRPGPYLRLTRRPN
ncbi:MAG: M23 family metallopeptidase [Actinomycetota bacterium]|nr:M23 family metallopeptidase [Actinomycetota bacterium]